MISCRDGFVKVKKCCMAEGDKFKNVPSECIFLGIVVKGIS